MLSFIRRMLTFGERKPSLRQSPPRPATRAVMSKIRQKQSKFRDLETGHTSPNMVEDRFNVGPGNRAGARGPEGKVGSGNDDTIEIVENGDSAGFDPYNSGKFERKDRWDMPRLR